MSGGGYIKLHKKVFNWEWFDDLVVYKLFTGMVMLANWKDGKFRGETIPRGSFVSSVRRLGETLKLSKGQIERGLKKLKAGHEIVIDPRHKYTIYTIVNYSVYQDSQDTRQDSKQDANRDTNRTQTETQTETQAEDNRRSKEVKNNNIPPIVPQRGGVEIAMSDWDAFCRKYQIQGIPLMSDLSDRVLAHLLAVLRDQKQGVKIRLPVAVAKKRAEVGAPERQDMRIVQAWLHPPPSEKECHCGGELVSSYATGGGYTALTCQKCGRVYTKK